MEESQLPKPLAQLFICCKVKEGKPSCGQKGSIQMVEDLKIWLKENQLNKKLRVSQSSCLGQCESGITACLYPKDQWFKNVTPSDLENLKKILISC